MVEAEEEEAPWEAPLLAVEVVLDCSVRGREGWEVQFKVGGKEGRTALTGWIVRALRVPFVAELMEEEEGLEVTREDPEVAESCGEEGDCFRELTLDRRRKREKPTVQYARIAI